MGICVIEKLHSSLRAALGQAVKWGYLEKNPALQASVPKAEHKTREVWTQEQAKLALNACTDELLRLCILLAIGCSLRIGEILGLQWSEVVITEESILSNTSTLKVKQELKRCDKVALEALASKNRSAVYFTFPEWKAAHPCKTALVLKSVKTKSSNRIVYIPNTVAEAMLNRKKAQEQERSKAGDCYQDFNMVISLPDGRPAEERLIAKKLQDLIQQTGLPKVVFHSLRHLSTSMKLQLSGGDIKAVQGDTGHAQAAMVTGVYGHTFTENRKKVADLMETSFFDTEEDHTAEDKKNEQILRLLKEKPELADLILAVLK